ncbi:cytochrome b/b6 domain-containing protein [Methylophilus aquaticus]|uniref:Cytochrome b/b6 domain-containing protein n=1 Tax=Methylophilus aquaticus TaxID=1971610 RepID=A0ABT9JQ71_9PROT|nr:cytochrome b/b6 domain-containing protein [Methylophilus aquaticus]MDP8566701.1 cytochrome b/b6 domain-containing protein [Methylophilus aquaticus]
MPQASEMLWPWWVRLSHWLVASGVIALWLMSYVWYETDWLHRLVGYAVLALVAARILLGCLTKVSSARFSLPRWHAIRAHIAEMQQRKITPHQGHNPVGQWAVYLIWLLIAALALTGWLSRTDALWGEDWPVEVHGLLSWTLLAVIVVHVAAVICVGQWSRQHLVRQMWHGRFEK